MPDHPSGRLVATLTLDLYRDEAGRVTFMPDILVRGDDPHAEDANLRVALLCLVEQLGRRAPGQDLDDHWVNVPPPLGEGGVVVVGSRARPDEILTSKQEPDDG
jgi:hypothetical protein